MQLHIVSVTVDRCSTNTSLQWKGIPVERTKGWPHEQKLWNAKLTLWVYLTILPSSAIAHATRCARSQSRESYHITFFAGWVEREWRSSAWQQQITGGQNTTATDISSKQHASYLHSGSFGGMCIFGAAGCCSCGAICQLQSLAVPHISELAEKTLGPCTRLTISCAERYGKPDLDVPPSAAIHKDMYEV